MARSTRSRSILTCLLLATFVFMAPGCNKKRYRITDSTTEYIYYARKVKEKRDGSLNFMDILINRRFVLEEDTWELEELKKKDFNERVDFHRGLDNEVNGPDMRRIQEAKEFPEEEDSGQ